MEEITIQPIGVTEIASSQPALPISLPSPSLGANFDTLPNVLNPNGPGQLSNDSAYPQSVPSMPIPEVNQTPHVAQSSGDLNFYIPKYSYADYINELSSWQKQLKDINGTIGWFYFKIFFKFDTEFGLFGGIGDNPNTNSAINYLTNISGDFQYQSCKIKDRIVALHKFINTLKYISLNVPWFFKGVHGINNIHNPYTTEFQKEKTIFIECLEEGVDMRIGTLLDLYKYTCYDTINCKEIIPANLRKFDMSVIIMHMPLKYHHEPTLFNSENGVFESFGKSLDMNESNDFSRLASFKMFTFQNCEIMLNESGEYYGDNITNEKPFMLGKNKIKINYDRVFEHRMNEWNEFLLGDDGFYYNNEFPVDLTNKNIELMNETGDDSTHRVLLDRINANHTITKDYLISYSDYFLNKVWETSRNVKWDRFLGNFRREANMMRNGFNSLRSNFNGMIEGFRNIGRP